MRQLIARTLVLLLTAFIASPTYAQGEHNGSRFTRNILLTGYWPPTNDMLRQFSPHREQNPDGWVGHNWEGLGYNIYAYFPEFPDRAGRGIGDFEVDYQDTAADWERIVAEIGPVAIITFSRGNTVRGWEIEPAYQRFRLPGEQNPPGRTVPVYTPDYEGIRFPSDVPITAEPVGFIRSCALPMQSIIDAVATQISNSQLDPFVAPFNPAAPDDFDFGGGFLSGYIGYLGVWHHDRNNNDDSSIRCVAAGHIHVGTAVNVAIAAQATEITLRALTASVTERLPFCRADFNRDSVSNSQDFFDFLSAFLLIDARADVNTDAFVNSQDFFDFLTAFFLGCP